MREIKFRAYNPITCVMSKPFTLADLAYHEGICIEFPDGDFHRPENCELMQFTGLCDKNGVDIYEGDILKYANSIENGIGEIKPFFNGSNLHCVWIEQQTSSPSMYTSVDYLGCPAEIEVIGNIHEKTELLEAK